MKKEFETIDLGLMKYFLGIEVSQTDDGIFICLTKYAKRCFEKVQDVELQANIYTCGNMIEIEQRSQDMMIKIIVLLWKQK